MSRTNKILEALDFIKDICADEIHCDIFSDKPQPQLNNFKINEDGSIDVDCGIELWGYDWEELPIQFNKINGFFYINRCRNLKTLKGFPKYLNGDLRISMCPQIKSLKGCGQLPVCRYILTDFFCDEPELYKGEL